LLGTAPRKRLISELARGLPDDAIIAEKGLLDDLRDTEIANLAPNPNEDSLVTFINGREVVLAKRKITQLADEHIAALQSDEHDLVVFLSTGVLRDFESSCPTVNGQRAVEAAIISVASQGDMLGIVVPLRRQCREVDIPALSYFPVQFSHASRGNEAECRRAAAELAECDFIVLNSVSYEDHDQKLMSRLTGKPVLLARQVIQSSIQLVLGTVAKQTQSELPAGLQRKLDLLTPRERQVLPLVCEGLSNKEIGRTLGISYKTVEIHRSSILKKMEVRSSGAMIRLVIGAGVE